MTFEELMSYFGNKPYREIAEKLDISPSQLTYYKQHGIPLGRQVLISEKTGGKLKISIKNDFKQP